MVRLLAAFVTLLFVGLIAAAALGLWVFYSYGRDLPSYAHLASWEPMTTTRVYAGDGRLMTEYAREPRVFVPYSAIPEKLKQAFVATEDQNFFSHYGVDPIAIARAMVTNLKNINEDQIGRAHV